MYKSFSRDKSFSSNQIEQKLAVFKMSLIRWQVVPNFKKVDKNRGHWGFNEI